MLGQEASKIPLAFYEFTFHIGFIIGPGLFDAFVSSDGIQKFSACHDNFNYQPPMKNSTIDSTQYDHEDVNIQPPLNFAIDSTEDASFLNSSMLPRFESSLSGLISDISR